jgi:signal transduction histidine kinase
MQAVFVALIAVLGTLGGALVSGVLSHRNTARSEAAARSEQLRQDRLEAYVAFALSLSALRGAQFTRWNTRSEQGRDSDEYRQAKADAYQTRIAARGALIRVELLTDHDEIVRLAREASTAATALEEADTEKELAKRAVHSRKAADAFVMAASRNGGLRP